MDRLIAGGSWPELRKSGMTASVSSLPLDVEFSSSSAKHAWLEWLGWEQEFDVIRGSTGKEEWHELLVAGRAPAKRWGTMPAHTIAQRHGLLKDSGYFGIGLAISAFEDPEFKVDTISVKTQKPAECADKLHMDGIPLHRHPIKDKTDNLGIKCKSDEDFAQMRNTVRLMDACVQSGRQVHVSCKAGVGRTAMILAAYLVTFGGLRVDQAASVLSRSRWVISLTKGRCAQLKSFRDWWRKHHQAADKSDASCRDMSAKLREHQDAIAISDAAAVMTVATPESDLLAAKAVSSVVQLTIMQQVAQFFVWLLWGQQKSEQSEMTSAQAVSPVNASVFDIYNGDMPLDHAAAMGALV